MKRIASAGLLVALLSGFCWYAPSPSVAQCCGSQQCAGDLNCDGEVTIDEIITAVNSALGGCPPVVGADQACADLATADCTKLDQCVFNGTTVRYGGASTCRNRQKQACLVRLGATGTGNSPTDVEQCVSSVPASTCSDFELGNIPDCEAKIGGGAIGAACAFPGQCESSNCAIVNGSNCGTCAPASHAGDSCATTSCSHGFTCIAATQQCQPIGNDGNVCDSNHPCAPGLTCVIPAAAASGTCDVSGASLGIRCDPKHQTAAGCNTGLGFYCNATSNTCAPVTYVTAGSQCGSVGSQVYTCTNGSTCFGAQGSTPGTCLADAIDGTACDTETGPSCIAPARCVTGSPTATTGTCRFPDPTKCS
ncbi:MAG: hypothetical protein HY270_01950 [Deltaproteobacteria bacterium]|nr:hypothetical protein [Deltaproteobacteria bacterium]